MFKIMDMAIWPLNKLINKTLQFDPESLDKLVPLAGKVLALEFTGIQQTVFVYVQVDGVRLSFSGNTPNTTLTGTPLAFMRMLTQPHVHTLNHEIKLNGDPHFAQHIQIILSGLSIDWEEQLSKFIGDNAAHQMGRLGKGVQQWLQDTRAALRTNTTEYLQQETQHLPERVEINAFLQDVDVLRNDVERVGARIKRLQHQFKE